MRLTEIEQQIDRLCDPVGTFCLVAGEVVELPEDDVDPDRIDEPDHDRVRDPPQQRPELEDSGSEHDHTGDDGECEQHSLGLVALVHSVDVGHDDRHCAGRLDRHEDGARREGPGNGPDHVGVQPEDRVHACEQSSCKAIRHALDPEYEA